MVWKPTQHSTSPTSYTTEFYPKTRKWVWIGTVGTVLDKINTRNPSDY